MSVINECLPSMDGVPLVGWVNYLFGECTYGAQDVVSLLAGYCSLLFWLNAQFPQLIHNYRKGSAQGISLPFLFIWLLGDAANLVGCILTHQLPFQRYLSMYFVSIDICLLSQWFYYNTLTRPIPYTATKQPSAHLFQHPSVLTPLLIEPHPAPFSDDLLPYSVSASPSKWYTLSATDHSQTKTATMLSLFLLGSHLTTTTLSTNTTSHLLVDDPMIVGRLFAWLCTALYLMSRIPQIIKNYQRRSVQGLSPSLFICAVGGNVSYTISILTHRGQTLATLLEALPYLIGSAGTLTFDATIFAQFFWYKNTSVYSSSIV
ncbi:PQ loop repeat-domain-containing protein [Spinellus fusiger]|nr:PQ loop repeat-domain-containing protein [Spinellus fusiger]